MWGKKMPEPSYIGPGITLRDVTIVGTEPIKLDCMVYGNIELDSTVELGERGIIEGVVRADTAIIAGLLNGDIECRDVLHVQSTGKITGKMSAARMVVDEGGSLCGHTAIGCPSIGDPEEFGYGEEDIEYIGDQTGCSHGLCSEVNEEAKEQDEITTTGAKVEEKKEDGMLVAF